MNTDLLGDHVADPNALNLGTASAPIVVQAIEDNPRIRELLVGRPRALWLLQIVDTEEEDIDEVWGQMEKPIVEHFILYIPPPLRLVVPFQFRYNEKKSNIHVVVGAVDLVKEYLGIR